MQAATSVLDVHQAEIVQGPQSKAANIFRYCPPSTLMSRLYAKNSNRCSLGVRATNHGSTVLNTTVVHTPNLRPNLFRVLSTFAYKHKILSISERASDQIRPMISQATQTLPRCAVPSCRNMPDLCWTDATTQHQIVHRCLNPESRDISCSSTAS